ncbi:MAG: hypothetical protein ACPGU3_07550 [Litorivicinus sp.]
MRFCCALVLALVSSAAGAIDLWLPARDLPRMLAEERNQRISAEISYFYHFPVSDRHYSTAEIDVVSKAQGLALVEARHLIQMQANGWEPLARFPRTQGVQLVRRADALDRASSVVGTPGVDTVEHWLAPALAPDARELVSMGSAGDCLRRLFTDVDGCLVQIESARAYQEKFGIELDIPREKAFRLPGPVLMQKPIAWDPQQFVGLQLDGARLVAWQDFDGTYYQRMEAALLRMKDESDSRTLIGDSSYTPVIQGESHDTIGVD